MMQNPRRMCRLCSSLNSHEIRFMEDTYKDIVEIVLPDLDIEYSDEDFICEACNELLQEFFKFKSTCLEIEDTIHNYTCEGQVQVDLEKIIGLTDIDYEKNGKICRMCLECLECDTFSDLDGENCSLLQMQQKCLPEMNFQLTRKPVICDKCENLLKKCYDFLSQCMENDKKHHDRKEAIRAGIEDLAEGSHGISAPGRILSEIKMSFTNGHTENQAISEKNQNHKPVRNKKKRRTLTKLSADFGGDSSGDDPDFIPDYESEDISDMDEDIQPKIKKKTLKPSNNNRYCNQCGGTFAGYDLFSLHKAHCKPHESNSVEMATSNCTEYNSNAEGGLPHRVGDGDQHEVAEGDRSKGFQSIQYSVTNPRRMEIQVANEPHNAATVELKVCAITSEDTCSQPVDDPVGSSNSLDSSNNAQALENGSVNSKDDVMPESANQIDEHFTFSSDHRQLTILKCDTCDFNTRSFQKIDQHVLTHLQLLKDKNQLDDKNQLMCPHCYEKFDGIEQIYRHLKDAHARCNFKLFHWCVDCAKVFSNEKLFAGHMDQCPRRNYVCKLFKSNRTMFCMLCHYESDDGKEARAHRDSCQFKRKTLVGDTIEID